MQKKPLPEDSDRLRGTVAAAERLDIHASTLKRWFHEGRVPGYRLGRHLKFRDSELDAFVASVREGVA